MLPEAGYQLRISDATKEQKYLQLLTNYNSDLEKDVAEKTSSFQSPFMKIW
ncbi:MAG: hypothetical protein IJR80_07650 [Treponema sp.]|nr:hypothetical protein [Treponema sp.]